jgi:DNA-binding protein HU-beta
VNKADLVEHIARSADLSRLAAERALDALVTAVKAALKQGQEVTLAGFGTFYVAERKARSGRNPRTGEPVAIAAARVPRFRAGKVFKDAIN